MKIWPFVAAAALLALLIRRRRQLEPTLLVGGALIAVVLCVYGSGAVKLPNLETLLVDIGQTLGQWTYLLVGVLAFLETGAFIGLVAPGETAMMLGGVVAGQGEINVITLIGVAWIAAVAGDCASYALGRRLGREFLVKHGSRVQIGPERLAQVETFFEKHGGKAIFIGRFVGIVRAVAPFLAGSGRMPFRRFIPYDVLGAGLWATTFIMIGYVFWQSFDRVLKIAKEGALGLGIAITLIAGIVWLVRWLQVAENRARLERDLDAALDRPGLRLLRPLVHWARGPLRFFIGRLTPGQLGLELTTLLAVAAVGSFAFLGYWILIAQGNASGLDAPANRWAVDIAQPALDRRREGAHHLRGAVADGAALRGRGDRPAAAPPCARGGGDRDRDGHDRRARADRQALDRPRASRERARRCGGLGLSLRSRGVRDGVDRAGDRRRPRRPGGRGAAGGSWSPRRCWPRSSG